MRRRGKERDNHTYIHSKRVEWARGKCENNGKARDKLVRMGCGVVSGDAIYPVMYSDQPPPTHTNARRRRRWKKGCGMMCVVSKRRMLLVWWKVRMCNWKE